jgi:hypothetical protein
MAAGGASALAADSRAHLFGSVYSYLESDTVFAVKESLISKQDTVAAKLGITGAAAASI